MSKVIGQITHAWKRLGMPLERKDDWGLEIFDEMGGNAIKKEVMEEGENEHRKWWGGKKGRWEEKRSSKQATFASSLHLSLASAAQKAALATCCHLALPCKQPHCHFLLTSTLFGPICISQTILPYSITVASSIPALFFHISVVFQFITIRDHKLLPPVNTHSQKSISKGRSRICYRTSTCFLLGFDCKSQLFL